MYAEKEKIAAFAIIKIVVLQWRTFFIYQTIYAMLSYVKVERASSGHVKPFSVYPFYWFFIAP